MTEIPNQKQHFFSKILLLILLCSSNYLTAQFSIKARLSRNRITVNENVQLSFEMNGDADNFTPPDLEHFDVLMGPSQSIRNSWINGQSSFSKTYTYVIAPQKQGKLIIKPARANYQGKQYSSNAVTINIEKARSQTQQNQRNQRRQRNNNPFSRRQYNNAQQQLETANLDLYLVTEVSKTTAYINEPVSITQVLYVPKNVRASNLKGIEVPKFEGCWKKDFEIETKESQVTYKGYPYTRMEIVKILLFPQKEGKISIDPMRVSLNVDRPSGSLDFFGRRNYSRKVERLHSKKHVLNIKALPLEGKPESFSGAVGDFAISSKTNKRQLDTSSSLRLNVTVTGRGNLGLFKIPEPKIPSSIEKYAPEYKDNTQFKYNYARGSIGNQYTLVPQFKGDYRIPSIEFTYFNPKSQKYITKKSQNIAVKVNQGKTDITTSNLNKASKYLVEQKSEALHFIKTNEQIVSKRNKAFFGSISHILWLIIPLLLMGISCYTLPIITKNSNLSKKSSSYKANKLIKQFLTQAQKDIGNPQEFYESLEAALHNFTKSKLGLATKDLNKSKIQEVLIDKKVSIKDCNTFTQLLTNCEMAKYTPSSQKGMQEDLSKAEKLLEQISKTISKNK